MSDSKSASEQSESEFEEDETPKTNNYIKLCAVPSGEFKCKRCGNLFPTKNKAYKHTRLCYKNKIDHNVIQRKQMLNKCMWCGLEFTNRGNLAAHAFHIHGDSSYKAISSMKEQLFTCHVCNKSYKTSTQLRYHIRSEHFNLQARVPYADLKKVNQIWFEKVQNSNKIMEIKKTGENTLIMRTLAENTGIKVNEVQTKTIDLSHIYPVNTGKRARMWCNECDKTYLKRDFKKHFDEIHLNKKKFACNNCKRTFKRAYQYLQHHCGGKRKIKGVTHKNTSSEIRISSVESLSVPLGC